MSAMQVDHPFVLLRKRPRADKEEDQEGFQASKNVHQSQKQFLRKNAKGRVLKVLRELYVRPDVPCGSSLCVHNCLEYYSACKAPSLSSWTSLGAHTHEDQEQFNSQRLKPLNPTLSSTGRPGFSKPHYVVLDTNVALHQMDLIESDAFGSDIIIPQTVLNEVRHRSLPLFNRLNTLNESTSRAWYFSNEAHNETFVERENQESANDQNDRAIRSVAKWYQNHLGPNSEIDIILLTDDNDNREKAIKDGVTAYSVREYVEKLPHEISGKLLDLVALYGEIPTTGAETKKDKKSILFQPHLPLADLQAGVKNGIYYQGHFNPNPYNFLEGSISPANFDKSILLIGRENMNRAVSGDVVAVQLLPKSEWKAPSDEVIEQEAINRNDDPDDSGEENDESQQEDGPIKHNETAAKVKGTKSEPQPTGTVVGIIRRLWRPYVCHLDRGSLSPAALESINPQNVFATPVDSKIPKIRIRTRQVANLIGCKFLVSIDRWDTTSRSPEGHFVRSLGQVESKEAEIEGLLLEYDVPYRPFSQAVLDCLPSEGDSWKVPPKDNPIWIGREDFRDVDICSIDPPGCQDIDDALHAKPLPNGNIEAGVHIADVSYFVRPENPMDAEAASRGTTVYLVDKRIDMLPPLLGTNLCSLRPYVERLAFSVIWELTPDADIVNVRFTKSVIASKAAFTYQEAQLRKDDVNLDDPITQGIRLLNKVATNLKRKRNEAGALNLASPEIKIQLDSSETTGPIDVEQKQLLETNSLVEEFMLLANISVAKKIEETFPQTAVLRRHGQPPSSNFEILKDILEKRKHMTLDVSSSGALASSLDNCIDPNMPSFNTLVRIMATRCMLSAEYFCSGSVAKDSFSHYGLATPIYTHFTSPIRRYADVMVHRQLQAAIDKDRPLHPTLQTKSFVDRVVDNINKRHRLAQQAGRASVGFYVALSVRNREELEAKQGHGQVIEEAFVIRAFKNGLAVFVSRLGLEGIVSFKQDNEFDAENYEISLPNSNGENVKIGVFDTVKVQITVVKDKHTQRGKVQMYLVEPVDCRINK